MIVEVEGKRLEFNGTEAAKKFSEEHGLLKVAEIQDEKRQRVRGTYRPYRVKGYARFRGDTRKYRNSAKKVKRGKKDE
ncbi:hypothetical protein GCM10010358_19910 [Streptomyces minutiscleroticus]|uniref:Uncharacterized protein n=1 Tax=Streptomyces minutiscleroticus TaxID=68238 RepID=A0A918KK57_9ACTN|nr:hypothetical protein GCM10010358_19910 [Streptomyces minutiscleroticus]